MMARGGSISEIDSTFRGAAADDGETAPAPRPGRASQAYAGPRGTVEFLDLRYMLNVLWRFKTLIGATALVFTAIAALAVFQATELYVATSQVVVETQREDLGVESVVKGSSPDFYTNATEAAIITSRSVVGKVVDELHLTEHPLFNPLLAEERGEAGRGFSPGRILRSLLPDRFLDRGEPEATELSREEEAAYLREYAIDLFSSMLSARPDEMSRVITIAVTSPDPYFAAHAATRVAEIYIQQSVAARYEATVRATDWLNNRVGDLRGRMLDSEAAVEAYRRDIGVLGLGNQATLYSEQLADVNEQLTRARLARAEAEARFAQIDGLVDEDEALATAAAVLDSPLIQRLQEQESEILRKLAELRTRVREGHPSLQLARNELADHREKIRAEVRKIATSVRNEAELAQVRVTNLETELDRLQNLVRTQTQAQVKLLALESEARANKQLFETILARFNEAGVQEQSLQQASARLISRAAVPGEPAYPRKGLIIGAALVLSLVVGVVLSFVIDHLDAGFRSLEQVEAVTGQTGIVLIPLTGRQGAGGASPTKEIIERPGSPFAEAMRGLRTSILLSSAREPPKTLLFTSAVPDEGKSSTAVAFARAAAMSGQRTILIDCDLRRSTVATLLDGPKAPGVTEFLTAQAALEEVIHVDKATGLHYIAAGRETSEVADALGSFRMTALIEACRAKYDLAVFDTSPVLAVADALMLLRHMDRTVFVVRWGKTGREIATAGIRRVADAGANLAGVVLTQVDLRKHAQYSYTHVDMGRYYADYGRA